MFAESEAHIRGPSLLPGFRVLFDDSAIRRVRETDWRCPQVPRGYDDLGDGRVRRAHPEDALRGNGLRRCLSPETRKDTQFEMGVQYGGA